MSAAKRVPIPLHAQIRARRGEASCARSPTFLVERAGQKRHGETVRDPGDGEEGIESRRTSREDARPLRRPALRPSHGMPRARTSTLPPSRTPASASCLPPTSKRAALTRASCVRGVRDSIARIEAELIGMRIEEESTRVRRSRCARPVVLAAAAGSRGASPSRCSSRGTVGHTPSAS